MAPGNHRGAVVSCQMASHWNRLHPPRLNLTHPPLKHSPFAHTQDHTNAHLERFCAHKISGSSPSSAPLRHRPVLPTQSDSSPTTSDKLPAKGSNATAPAALLLTSFLGVYLVDSACLNDRTAESGLVRKLAAVAGSAAPKTEPLSQATAQKELANCMPRVDLTSLGEPFTIPCRCSRSTAGRRATQVSAGHPSQTIATHWRTAGRYNTLIQPPWRRTEDDKRKRAARENLRRCRVSPILPNGVAPLR